MNLPLAARGRNNAAFKFKRQGGSNYSIYWRIIALSIIYYCIAMFPSLCTTNITVHYKVSCAYVKVREQIFADFSSLMGALRLSVSAAALAVLGAALR